jgi:hypothetical protein
MFLISLAWELAGTRSTHDWPDLLIKKLRAFDLMGLDLRPSGFGLSTPLSSLFLLGVQLCSGRQRDNAHPGNDNKLY